MDEEDLNIFYAVSLPADPTAGQNGGLETTRVFVKKDEALKFCKGHQGSRFKAFTNREDAIRFAATVAPNETNPGLGATGEKLPFGSLKPQEMTVLRRVIEKGQEEVFNELVWSNPRYLISSGESATPLKQGQRYNGLHVAAMQNQPRMCRLILETVGNPGFVALLYPGDSEQVREDRVKCLLDSYLNTADPARNETPLHFASKFGNVDCVEVLVSYPQCNRERRNKENQTPAEVICSRTNRDADVKEKIEFLLGERFFVPIYRAPDNTVQPIIAQPWSPDSKDTDIQSPIREEGVDLNVTAYAGPMSHQDADSFYKKLKTPIRRLLRFPGSSSPNPSSPIADQVRLMDAEKGVETQGRELARNSKLPWTEYWAFIDAFCDLTSVEGLTLFENYLRRSRSEMRQSTAFDHSNPLSPMTDLCLQFEKISLKIGETSSSEDDFVTPPSSPTSAIATPPYEDPLTPFINGTEPGKVDIDAYFALRNVPIDFRLFPNVSAWKDSMLQHSEDELMRIKLSHRGSALRSSKATNRRITMEKPSSPVPPLLQGMMSPSQRSYRSRTQTGSSPAPVRLADRFSNLLL